MLKLTPEDQAKYMLDLYREGIVVVDEVRAALNLSGDSETIQELKRMQLLKNNIALSELNPGVAENVYESSNSLETTNDNQEDDKIEETKGKEE